MASQLLHTSLSERKIGPDPTTPVCVRPYFSCCRMAPCEEGLGLNEWDQVTVEDNWIQWALGQESRFRWLELWDLVSYPSGNIALAGWTQPPPPNKSRHYPTLKTAGPAWTPDINLIVYILCQLLTSVCRLWAHIWNPPDMPTWHHWSCYIHRHLSYSKFEKCTRFGERKMLPP